MTTIIIDIEQVDKRKYKVYLNNEFVDYIFNRLDYHNKYISKILTVDAENLARTKGLIPRNHFMQIRFIGDIKHEVNK